MTAKPVLAALALLALVACDPQINTTRADASYIAKNGFLVHPIGGGRFEVTARGAGGASGYFCAAADYARVRLGASPADRVVLTEPIGPAINSSAARTAKFAVAPRGSVRSKGITSSMRRAGENRNIEHARQACGSSFSGFLSD